MNNPDYKSLPGLLQRLRNAKRRLHYWSGNPSFSTRMAIEKYRRCSDMYEMYRGDVMSLRNLIKILHGKDIPDYDPKAEFQRRWIAMIRKVPK